MIEILWGGSRLNPEVHEASVAYVDERIGGGGRGFGLCKTMTVLEDGEPLGVVVFHNWNPEAEVIEISAAADSRHWLTRKTLNRIFSYAFDDCGCQMVVARIAETNTPLHSIFHRYGFDSFVVPRLRGRNADERIFTLTDDVWRAGKFRRS